MLAMMILLVDDASLRGVCKLPTQGACQDGKRPGEKNKGLIYLRKKEDGLELKRWGVKV
jgi:hypothetical protein